MDEREPAVENLEMSSRQMQLWGIAGVLFVANVVMWGYLLTSPWFFEWAGEKCESILRIFQ